MTPGKPKLPLAVQDTIRNSAFIRCLEQGVTEAAHRTFDGSHPTYLPGAVGQFMYFFSIDTMSAALRNQGYNVERDQMQLRLYARDRYACPVRLRFGIGRKAGNNLIFNWPKGSATAVGVRQNKQLLGFNLQRSLFSLEEAEDGFIEPELNLWIVYSVQQDHLRAILGMGIESLSSTMIYCDQIVEICNKPLAIGSGADFFIGSNDSDIDIEFGEKPTGTE